MHPDAELLSSYLDGELGAAERATVEQLLIDDAAARELLAELQSLRDDLSLVPRHRLPEEFANEVLRSAERLMLLGPAELPLSPASETASDWVDLAPRVAGRHLWRSPAWFITGAAAAVLLMIGLGSWRGGGNREGVDRTFAENGKTSIEPAASPHHRVGVGERRVPDDPIATSPSATTVHSDSDGDNVSVEEPTVASSPEKHSSETISDPSVPLDGMAAFTGASGEEQAPLGLVVTCQMKSEAIIGREFDALLREHGIAVPYAKPANESDKATNDIVYVEATPAELDGVFQAMGKDPDTYHSPIMQLTLGMFRDPTLWSEMLDAGQGADSQKRGEAAATNEGEPPHAPSNDTPGSRAIHITPDDKPAKPLVFEKATLEELMEYGAQLTSQFPTADEPADKRPPVVDNGLVRAVFFLCPLPAADAALPTP